MKSNPKQYAEPFYGIFISTLFHEEFSLQIFSCPPSWTFVDMHDTSQRSWGHNSHHPRSHSKSVVTTLFQRAENLTSSNDARENEHQYVTNVRDIDLKGNNYPKSFLYDFLRRPTLTYCSSPESVSAVKVPYIQRIAEPIRRVQ